MKMCLPFALMVLVVLALGSPSLAGKGGKPTPPPPDPAIAYIKAGGWSAGSIMVANEDGTNQKVVLAAGASVTHGRPSWSPDGTMLAFDSNVQGDGIYTIRIDGTGLTKIAATNSAIGGNAVWSPAQAADGQYKIAFDDLPRNTDGSLGSNADIFLVNLDGSGLQNLTNTPDVYEAAPTWSPSATRLALWDIGDDNILHLDILVLDIGLGSGGLEVTATTNLTSEADVPGGLLNDARAFNPRWAKSQDRIVIRIDDAPALNGGSDLSDLWIIDLDDPANPTNLTGTPDVAETHPTWSSDDSKIMYHTGGDLFVLPADGSGSASEIVANGGHADWRR
jgi:Tol biopolymer transport system component